MPRPLRIVRAALALSILLPAPALAGVRAIVLQGDPVPGIPAATFASFPNNVFATAYAAPPQCDSLGRCAFYATLSTGGQGIWSNGSGPIAPVAVTGDVLPWASGTGTLQAFGPFLMSDAGQVVFYGGASLPATTYGLWYRDASGFAFAAGDGVSAPVTGLPTTWKLSPADFSTSYFSGPFALSPGGQLALNTTTALGYRALWTFDPPPVVNRSFCASTQGYPSVPSFGDLKPAIAINDHAVMSTNALWYNGSIAQSCVAEGACGGLGLALTNGDLAPPVGDLPHTANIANIGGNGSMPPSLNSANAVAFVASLVNGGVTSANDQLVMMRDAGGFEEVAREGWTLPELLPGETIAPFTLGSGTPHDLPPIVSDAGTALLAASILPSNTPAVLEYRKDRTLHVLARDRAPAPGFPQRLLGISLDRVGTAYSLNHSGQALLMCWTRDSLAPDNSFAFKTVVYITDATHALVPILTDGDTYTVRTGLTGMLHINLPTGTPLVSNGTDGRWRDFSNKGDFVFCGTFTPGGGSPIGGVFSASGPDLSPLAAGPGPAGGTRLLPPAPNPFAAGTLVRFELARPGRARLEVIDLAGRRMRTLCDGPLEAGPHELAWTGEDAAGQPAPRGIYFVRLLADGASRCERVVMLR